MHKELQLKAQKTEAITQMGKEHEQTIYKRNRNDQQSCEKHSTSLVILKS